MLIGRRPQGEMSGRVRVTGRDPGDIPILLHKGHRKELSLPIYGCQNLSLLSMEDWFTTPHRQQYLWMTHSHSIT